MYPGVGVGDPRDEEMPMGGRGNLLSLAEEQGRGQLSKTDTFRQKLLQSNTIENIMTLPPPATFLWAD